MKVSGPERTAMLNLDWTVRPSSSFSLSSNSFSAMAAALLDPDVSEPFSHRRIVRRKFRVGQRVLAYLQSHSAVLATVCGLLSCRKSQPTPPEDFGQEYLTERCTVYRNKTQRKNVQYDGCTFVTEDEVLYESAGEGQADGGLSGGNAAAGIDENLRDYVFRKLRHQLPTLKRFLVQFLSPLMPGSADPASDPFWLLCSREIPDELCAVLPSLFADRYFACYVYCHISELLRVHSLQLAGFDQTESNRRSAEDILRLFDVVPSSVVQNSILWAVLRDFVVVSAVQAGSLSLAYTLRVRDSGTRCRLLMSMTMQVDPSERSLFSDVLKSCLTDCECPGLKRVVEKRIVTEKLYSEVYYYYYYYYYCRFYYF